MTYIGLIITRSGRKRLRIYGTLSELGVKMIVANPNAVRAIAEAKIKTDMGGDPSISLLSRALTTTTRTQERPSGDCRLRQAFM